MMIQSIKSLGCGALSGAVNGLFGAGGGVIFVPLSQRLRLLQARESFACSLAVMLPISAVSLFVYWQQGSIDTALALPCCLGGALGGLLGGVLYKRIPARLLHGMFGVLLMYAGLRQLL